MTDWVWGVDVSTKAIAIACVHGNRHELRTLTIAAGAKNPPRRAMVAHDTIQTWATSIATTCPPIIVFIELPTGRYPKPELMAMYGVVRMAIYRALHRLYPHPVTIRTITVGDWKKTAIGHGNAGKQHVADWAVYTMGAAPKSQDECDALGIAVAGMRQTRLKRAA